MPDLRASRECASLSVIGSSEGTSNLEMASMASIPGPTPTSLTSSPEPQPAALHERWMSELNTLLHQLQDAAQSAPAPVLSEEIDSQLVQVRLGVAASLFAALQFRHPQTAGHALRVALTVSAWARKMGLPAEERDHIEIAGLLHDIGVLGVPDQVVLKPGALDADETTIMSGARQIGLEILRRSCAAQEILDIVEHMPAWINGAGMQPGKTSPSIPRGSRMLAIAEAYDAMTTDHVYRPAMSQETAMAELFQYAGTQFDPDLVRQFTEYQLQDQTELHRDVASRWLQSLDPKLVNSYWQLNCVPSAGPQQAIQNAFQTKLLENMYDAVVFIDAGLRVVDWNHGAERLTGISSNSIVQRAWQTDILRMCDEKGQPVKESDCPVQGALRSGVQSLRRMTVWGRSGRPIAVDVHTIPVAAQDGRMLGAILLLHDASSETSLEQRCQTLYDKATKDPLTQVANRAEFDRVLKIFVAAHQQQQVPCGMIICDLDRFKQVNDTYGHQAGDEVIKGLATLLKNSCRPGDLVARYGGEEFVMLCADCDNATAARRAEQIRHALSQLPHALMNGRCATASFGATEVQPGDTPETMLRRADRALLMAKSRGRNMVVQLGAGSVSNESKGTFWNRQASPAGKERLLEQDLITPVPIKMAVEKLRGFVADHEAQIVAVEGNSVRLEITESRDSWMRRLSDRPVSFCMELKLEEERVNQPAEQESKDFALRTKIHVAISPRRNRDRRRDDVTNRARQVLVSFRSYLMATDASTEPPSKGVLRRVGRMLTPWINR